MLQTCLLVCIQGTSNNGLRAFPCLPAVTHSMLGHLADEVLLQPGLLYSTLHFPEIGTGTDPVENQRAVLSTPLVATIVAAAICVHWATWRLYYC